MAMLLSRVTILVLCSLLGARAASLSDLTDYGIDVLDSLPLTDFGIGAVVYSAILDFVGLYNCNFYKDVEYDLSQLQLYHYSFGSDNVTTTTIYNVSDGAGSLIQDMRPDAANYSYNIFIPGFNSGPNATSWSAMRSAYGALNNTNIKYFALDHTEYTSVGIFPLISYDNAVTYTYHIGKQMGEYIAELVNYGVPIENIYVVGHSLGAHMTGVTASHLKNLTGQSLPRITGLDPAAPCFTYQPLDVVIDDTDADYVDIMHCDAGGFGWTNNYGSADFYPNGGKSQPTCEGDKIFVVYNEEVSACSHSICPIYFALSLLEELEGQLCDSYKDYTDEECEDNLVAVIGQQYNATSDGTYYLTLD